MATTVIIVDEFRDWYLGLSVAEQESVRYSVSLLEQYGAVLEHPHSTKLKGSKQGLRELRVQHAGEPYGVLYVFDPGRQAVLLLGGNKIGKGNRWYPQAIREAERRYMAYLQESGQA